MVALSATSPYFGLNLIKGFEKYNDKKAWRKFYHSLYYLNRRGYVKILDSDNGNVRVKITNRGETIVKELDIDALTLKELDNWDGKWRIIIFDVPNTKSKNRLAFTERIKSLGFIMIQKSVWAYPVECYEEVMILRKFYEIEKYVTYLEVIEVEDEINWRGKLNLKRKNPTNLPV